MIHRVLAQLCLLLTLAVVATAGAQAHQQKAAITSVAYNARSQSIEVVHRFYLHDAEHAMQQLGDPRDSIVSDPDVQKAFADYVAQHFSMTPEGGDPLELTLVGYELERAYIFIYQEARGWTGEASSIDVGFSALLDIWPDQSNMVNVELGPCVKTVIFEGRKKDSTVQIGGSHCQ